MEKSSMNNVSRLISQFSAHPVWFLIFFYFALPILVWVYIYEFCCKYVFPHIWTGIKYISKKVWRLLKYCSSKVYSDSSNPKAFVNRCKKMLLNHKQKKLAKEKESLLAKEKKREKKQKQAKMRLARNERLERQKRQSQQFKVVSESFRVFPEPEITETIQEQSRECELIDKSNSSESR